MFLSVVRRPVYLGMKRKKVSSVFNPGSEITSWRGVKAAALKFNAAALRQRLQPDAILRAPVYVCGRMFPAQASLVTRNRARVVLYGLGSARAFAAAGREAGKPVRVHLNVETGIHRQGLPLDEALPLAQRVQNLKGLVLEGLSTRYADMDVPTDHTFAMQQFDLLHGAHCRLRQSGIDIPIVHSANSAATILWPQTNASLVRTGIAAYGLWPSEATRTMALQSYADGEDGWQLEPMLSWRVRVAQIKKVPAGACIGYGRTFQEAHPMHAGRCATAELLREGTTTGCPIERTC